MKTAREYLDKADAYEEAELFDEALKDLKNALRVTEDKGLVYKRIADAYRELSRMDEAVSAIRKAIKLRPEDVDAREMLLDMLLETAQYDEALHEADCLIAVHPRSLSAREVMSVACIQTGRLDEAMRLINELIAMDPSSAANHFKRAWIYQQKGDYANAINEYTRVLDMEPDDEMADDAQQAIDAMDSFQLRQIITLALEDFIFRAKLTRDSMTAALERGFVLSHAGMTALKQVKFDELPEVYSEWKQRYYH